MRLVDDLVNSNLSFAVWREPFQVQVKAVASDDCSAIQPDGLAEVVQTRGFVFAPFDVLSHPVLWIPAQYTTIEEITKATLNSQKTDVGCETSSLLASYDEYIAQAQYLIARIRNGELGKVVLSRIAQEAFDVVNSGRLFEQLCLDYPSAYVFCVYTPYSGMWMGATPELLLGINGSVGSTVALAGTRRSVSANDKNEVVGWKSKEMDEQAIVTEFIDGVLQNHQIADVSKNGPVQVRAGQVSHLKTTFDFTASLTHRQLTSLLFSLHPTPAVSGVPQKKAMEAISRTELHDRLYYGGFLGEMFQGACRCYVTLRCMRVANGHAYLYVGGGLTQDSDPQLEWDETVLKSQTLLSVLKNI